MLIRIFSAFVSKEANVPGVYVVSAVIEFYYCRRCMLCVSHTYVVLGTRRCGTFNGESIMLRYFMCAYAAHFRNNTFSTALVTRELCVSVDLCILPWLLVDQLCAEAIT